MNNNSRGSISQQGHILRIDNALVEEVFSESRNTGYLIVSHSVFGPNRITFIELLRLNINRNTVILNANGIPMCFCDIQKGMWIDTLFSPIMTRSIPPQSNAFLVAVKRNSQPPLSVTTARIASVDTQNRFLYTGSPNNPSRQMRFTISENTAIRDRNGFPINLAFLRPGQMVRVTHANFQTASIPPQSPAYYVQLI